MMTNDELRVLAEEARRGGHGMFLTPERVIALLDDIAAMSDGPTTEEWMAMLAQRDAEIERLRAENEALTTRQHLHHVWELHDQLQAENERLRTLAKEMRRQFIHPGCPGAPAHQSGWVRNTTLQQWDAALADAAPGAAE